MNLELKKPVDKPELYTESIIGNSFVKDIINHTFNTE